MIWSQWSHLVMTNSSPWFVDGPSRNRWLTELIFQIFQRHHLVFFSRTRLSLRFRKRPPVWDALEIHADLPYKGRHGILPYAHQRASLNKRSPKKGVTCWTGAAYDPSLKCRPKMTKVELVHFWRPNLPIWNSDKDRPIVSIHILTLRE